MSTKTAVVVTMEHAQPSDRGKMAHALNLARELEEKGQQVRLIFCGKSVEWLPELTNPEREEGHPFVNHYGHNFDVVRHRTEACNFCTRRFDVREEIAAADIPIVGEGKAHMELSDYVVDGWQIVTF
ncbi:MAG: hypothetical protein KTR31_18985 [Myxococcales bacterium]|nr:hypothetical protein [Myxococcales bacterium]